MRINYEIQRFWKRYLSLFFLIFGFTWLPLEVLFAATGGPGPLPALGIWRFWGLLGVIVVLTVVIRWGHERPIRLLFNLEKGQEIIIVCPHQARWEAIGKAGLPTTYEDALAQMTLQSLLAEMGIPYRSLLHTQIQNNDRSQHLFLIGGPKANNFTRDLLCHPKILRRYDFEKRTPEWVHDIVDEHKNVLHPTPESDDVDFGIVAKITNPWSYTDSQTSVYLAAGRYGLGTWGAVYLLANQASYLKKRFRLDNGSSFHMGFWAFTKSTRGNLHPYTIVQETKPLY